MFGAVELMQKLSQKRTVFHSEKDFQHALAWQMHLESPDLCVRLEYPFRYEKVDHLDIVLFQEDQTVAFEVKYKKDSFSTIIDKEVFSLRKDSAQDIGRYDFLKDVQRLERFVSKVQQGTGYAILLTNDSLYWRDSPRETICDAFRLTETTKIAGKLSWSAGAGRGTTKDRESPITLEGAYICRWRDYSEFEQTEYPVGDEKHMIGRSKFRYLVFTVQKG
jgi:hypothetical protein